MYTRCVEEGHEKCQLKWSSCIEQGEGIGKELMYKGLEMALAMFADTEKILCGDVRQVSFQVRDHGSQERVFRPPSFNTFPIFPKLERPPPAPFRLLPITLRKCHHRPS